MKQIASLTAVVLFLGAAAFATIFGSVRGVVHDPQHRPIQGAHLTLKAQNSDWTKSLDSDGNGEFDFTSVPIGNYTVTVSSPSFQPTQQAVIVQSDTSPVLHFELAIAGVKETVGVSGTPVEATMDSVTPTTMVSRIDIQETPGADRTNGMEMITDYVPARLCDARHAAYARRPPGRVADRRRPHPQHQHRQQSGAADRPQGHRLPRSSERQLRRRLWRPHLRNLQHRAPHRF